MSGHRVSRLVISRFSAGYSVAAEGHIGDGCAQPGHSTNIKYLPDVRGVPAQPIELASLSRAVAALLRSAVPVPAWDRWLMPRVALRKE